MGTILIQIVFYQILFLALYEVLLKRDTHYNLQRLYLLLSPIIAMVLPFAVVPSLSETLMDTYAISIPTVTLKEAGKTSETSTTGAETISSTSYSVLFILWIVGSFLSGIWFLWKYRKLQQLRTSVPIVDKGSYKLASLPNTDVAFSFGNTIYLGKELEEEAREVIVKHEKVHVAQRHSVDLIVYQLLRIVFWWNPILYLFQNRLQAVHEYIADAEVVQSIVKKDYYQSLLSQVFKTNNISFTNTFYKQSLIKNRIIMLQKIKSSKRSKLKYLLVLPLLAFMLFVVSCTNDEADIAVVTEDETSVMSAASESEVYKVFKEFLENNSKEDGSVLSDEELQETLEKFQEILEKHSGKVGSVPSAKEFQEILEKSTVDNVSFTVIEKAPVYPGCEGQSEKELRDCMNQKIIELVQESFNTDLGKELGLEGIQRIAAVFTIDASGNISDLRIRTPHEELENETRRVINLFPRFLPGEHNGEKVGVTYTLPIVFEVGSED